MSKRIEVRVAVGDICCAWLLRYEATALLQAWFKPLHFEAIKEVCQKSQDVCIQETRLSPLDQVLGAQVKTRRRQVGGAKVMNKLQVF